MRATTQVSPLVATPIWIGFLVACGWLWIRLSRSSKPSAAVSSRELPRSSLDGAILLSLMLDSRSWITHREDAIELVDGLWFDCSITVHIAATGSVVSRLEKVSWIPLEILPKATTANVDICEAKEGGERLLLWPHYKRLAEESLATLARSILGKECSGTTAAAIRDIVSSPPAPAQAALRRLRRAGDPESRALISDAVFTDLAAALADGELLLASHAGERALKLSYRYRLERSRLKAPPPSRGAARHRRRVRRRLRHTAEAVGWRVRGFPIDFRGSFQGAEHVCTVRLPKLAGEAAEIVTTLVTAPGRPGVSPRWHNADIREGELSLLLPPSDRPSDLGVRLLMQPRRGSDLLAGTMFITGFIWAALMLGTFRLEEVGEQTEAMTALLAIVPSLIVPLLWRREHAIVTFLFAGLRRMTMAVFVAGLVAVLVLIGGFCGSDLRVPWTLSFVVATAGFLVASVANLRSPRLPVELRRSSR